MRANLLNRATSPPAGPHKRAYVLATLPHKYGASAAQQRRVRDTELATAQAARRDCGKLTDEDADAILGVLGKRDGGRTTFATYARRAYHTLYEGGLEA